MRFFIYLLAPLWMLLLSLGIPLSNQALFAQHFSTSTLSGTDLFFPTSLQFGPDNRLYVTQQNGFILAYTIEQRGKNDYHITATERIDIIRTHTPNHNDDGTYNPDPRRQLTGLWVTGTPNQPIIYAASSDWRYSGFGNTESGIDTNSGVLSRLTKTANGWEKVDLVRGLPRSVQDHSCNGLVIQGNTLYLTVGGHTNSGGVSQGFAFSTEYALSASILAIDLAQIESMPILTEQVAGKSIRYIYDLPTLDDPTRPNVNGKDQGDPFGGNWGMNQAKWVPNGPVQVYASGFRNVYDVLISNRGFMYTWDNGANRIWGGFPANEGIGSATNQYDPTQPGVNSATDTDPVIENRDGLHLIKEEGYYGGHPNPLRANPMGAGLYYKDTWYGPDHPNLPSDWPPLPQGFRRPEEGDYQTPGLHDPSMAVINSSTNGIVEYTAPGNLQGNILAASWNGNIYRVEIGNDGRLKPGTGIQVFATGIGENPIDVTAQGSGEIFPGTVWVLNFRSQDIVIFEPGEAPTCVGGYQLTLDEDGDGYSNADEIDNNTDPCNGASKPQDFDQTRINGFLVSDLNDPDDDDDGLTDEVDPFCLDPYNGTRTNLPLYYVLQNGDPGIGFWGLGFTGLMVDGRTDYLNLIQEEENSDVEIIAGGAVGLFTLTGVDDGDATGAFNSQRNAFQFGINVNQNTPTFIIDSRIAGPIFPTAPRDFHSGGLFMGTGKQDNFIRIGVAAGGGNPVIEVVQEVEDTPTVKQYEVAGVGSAIVVNLFLKVNPAAGTVLPMYALNDGPPKAVGAPIVVKGALLSQLQNEAAIAVGGMATSRGSSDEFSFTWDHFRASFENQTPVGDVIRINCGGPGLSVAGENWGADQYYNGGNVYVNQKDIDNTEIDPIYQSLRYRDIAYEIPVSNPEAERYGIELHFSEIYHTEIGKRIFDVVVEGNTILKDFDIVAAGGAASAVVESLEVPAPADGIITISLVNGPVESPIINGIKITPLGPEAPKNEAPVANFSAVIRELTLSLDAAASLDPDGRIVDYTWDLGDGNTSSGETLTYTYQRSGTYDVTLVVTDTAGATGSAVKRLTLTAPNQAPTANFEASMDGLDVTFDGSLSVDPEGAISSYVWDFGDGFTGVGVQVAHTYAQEGVYDVVLTVTDDMGSSHTSSQSVEVLGPNEAPVVSFRYSSVRNPQAITFDATASYDPDGTIVEAQWDFDDGTEKTGMIVQHVFETGGSYRVKLSVTDDRGGESSVSRILEVRNNTFVGYQVPRSSSVAIPGWSFAIYPNPLLPGERLHLMVRPTESQEVVLRLVNVNGQVLYQTPWQLTEDQDNTRILPTQLIPGAYRLMIQTQQGAYEHLPVMIR